MSRNKTVKKSSAAPGAGKTKSTANGKKSANGRLYAAILAGGIG